MIEPNRKAVRDLKLAASSQPGETTFLAVARALLEESDPREAAKYAARAVKVAPDSWSAHMILAKALVEQGKPVEALSHADTGLRLKPNGAAAVAAHATILRNLGRLGEAREAYRHALHLDPSLVAAYTGYVWSGTVVETDMPILERMIELSREQDGSQKPSLRYALGKAWDDLGDYEKAMGHFDEANRLAQSVEFDRALHRANREFAIRYFDQGTIDAYAGLGHDATAPIFVVGMLRSGTTLVEQILSAHPWVGASGEQGFWSTHRSDALRPDLREVDATVLNRLAFEYLALLNEAAPGKPRIVDKMPGNFAVLGLIHLALPKAKIVHVTRNPADTCLSIYGTPNRTRVSWSHSKPDIAFAYREYRTLMSHWRTVLPATAVIDVSYEDLVVDTGTAVGRLLELLNLPWAEDCLRPEENRRPVSTPSFWQVRQPIYRSSVGRWKSYAPWIEPFRELLSGEPHRDEPTPLIARSPLRRAKALEQLHRGFEAIEPYREYASDYPSIEVCLRLSELELANGRPEASVEDADRALKLNPDSSRAHEQAALGLMALERMVEADGHWKRAIELSRGPEAEIRRARALTEHGFVEEASAALEETLARFPKSPLALSQLAWITKASADDNLLGLIEELLQYPKLADRERRALEFASGKVATDLGRFQESSTHFERGNRLGLAELERAGKFSCEGYAANLALRREAFGKSGPDSVISDSDRPIFVIGNLRSGTTLVERVLAAHSQVGSAGELDHWTVADPRLIDPFRRAPAYATLRERTEIYLRILDRFRNGAERVVDKQPGNVLLAGALHRVLPNARIICVRRSLADTAVSIWTTNIHSTARYMHSKKNIAFALREHEGLVEHWKETIPDNRLHFVGYEEMVTSPEPAIRRLIDFCGLPWSDACLVPKGAPGRVSTPSAAQVRQSVHRSSVGRWRNYQPWLGEFRQLLTAEERDVRGPAGAGRPQ